MRRFNLIALAVFIGALVWVFTFDNAATRNIQNRVSAIFAPFKRTGAGVQDAITGASDEKRTPEQLRVENEKLAIENAELKIYRSRMQQVQEEMRRLQGLLKFDKQTDLALIPAKIIVRKTSAWYRGATIDKGWRQGVQDGSPLIVPLETVKAPKARLNAMLTAGNVQIELKEDPAAYKIGSGDTVDYGEGILPGTEIVSVSGTKVVLSNAPGASNPSAVLTFRPAADSLTGLVGRVARVSENESEIYFVTEEQCKVSAQVEGSIEHGIVEGVRISTARRPELRLRHLSKDARVEKNRRVFSWDTSNRFPQGLMLGTVVEFRPGDASSEAILEPAVNLDDLPCVFVMEQKVEEKPPPPPAPPPR